MHRRLTAALATKKPSRTTPFVGFFSATFLRLLERFVFLYCNRKNVIYRQERYASFGLEIILNIFIE